MIQAEERALRAASDCPCHEHVLQGPLAACLRPLEQLKPKALNRRRGCCPNLHQPAAPPSDLRGAARRSKRHCHAASVSSGSSVCSTGISAESAILPLRANHLLPQQSSAEGYVGTFIAAAPARRSIWLRSELALRTPFRDVRIGEEGFDLDLGRTLQRRLSEALKEMKHGSVRS